MQPDPIGQERGYRILRHVADGGMGSVFEAELLGAEGFRKTVAVKTILARYAAHPEFVRLFIGEAKLVADLVHENIVQVYDLGRESERYYIVMEFVRGLNLEVFVRSHLDRGDPLPIELGAFIASRVCRGLDYAHQRRDPDGVPLGIVHRDISPKNVLLNFEGVVKITDFGIAKAREVMEQDEELLVGRIEYMAPEQATRRPTDARSDVYALGVLAHELLTGRLPDRGRWSLERLHRLGAAYPKPMAETRPDVPDDLAAIVERALQPDPGDRFQSAADMGYALEYHLYHKGYGPTNVTLRDYLREHFPDPAARVAELQAAPSAVADTVIGHRADTLFGHSLEDEAAD
ncbi:MAG: serine/threonine protein kinase [Thermoanaerobaculales bacterium]|nr:serine/threonine protein kinase [Thermoanaerobaculales bacterium]